MKNYLVGIDIGTGGVRVAVFDLKGHLAAFSTVPLQSYIPGPGMTEQNPEDWWSALGEASKQALRKANVTPEEIAGIGIDTTGTTVCVLDQDMKPLRPAIMWCDVRATSQAKRVAASGSHVLKYNGFGNVSAEWAAPKILWLKEEEPQRWSKIHCICGCLEYMSYRLTGEMAFSINLATMRWYYDGRNGGWQRDFFEQMGMGEAVDKFPQTVKRLGERLGNGLTEEAAAHTGLLPGTPVGVGGVDASIATIGMGVVKPGIMSMITGTSNAQYVLLDREVHDRSLYGTFPDSTIPGYYGLEGGQISSGAVIKWFTNGGYCEEYRRKAQEQGRSLLDLLNEEAAKIPIGSQGLIMLEYLQGNRTPWVDSEVRGMMYGLSLDTTPARIYRAILEATCYGTALIIKAFLKYMDRPERIHIGGGLSQSDLYLHILADVTGIPICTMEHVESTSFGSAILGSVAAGVYDTIEDAVNKMVRVGRLIEPDMNNHEKYQFYVNKYEQAYLLMKDWMHEVSEHALLSTSEVVF